MTKLYNGKTVKELSKVYHEHNHRHFTGMELTAHDSGIQAIAEACSPKWIAVGERWPKEGDRIWFKTKKYEVFAGTIYFEDGICFVGPERKRDRFSMRVLGVTHWMHEISLPQPPQQGNV